jgi:hypothetical protein
MSEGLILIGVIAVIVVLMTVKRGKKEDDHGGNEDGRAPLRSPVQEAPRDDAIRGEDGNITPEMEEARRRVEEQERQAEEDSIPELTDVVEPTPSGDLDFSGTGSVIDADLHEELQIDISAWKKLKKADLVTEAGKQGIELSMSMTKNDMIAKVEESIK